MGLPSAHQVSMAASEARVRAQRAGSNAAIAAHDAEGVASRWLPDVCITHTTHGQHNGEHAQGAEENLAILSAALAAQPNAAYNYVREPERVRAMDELGFAWEEGRWHGSGTDAGAAAATVERHGFYFAQWQLKGDEWLIKSEVYTSLGAPQDEAAAEAAAAQIRTNRATSNRAVAAQDIEAQACFWMPDYANTNSSGATTVGREANKALVAGSIAEHPDVRFERLADRIEVDFEAGLAAEFGRWEGGWTSDEGAAVVRSGRFCGQWRWASEVEQWLLNAEIYVPEHDVVASAGDSKL